MLNSSWMAYSEQATLINAKVVGRIFSLNLFSFVPVRYFSINCHFQSGSLNLFESLFCKTQQGMLKIRECARVIVVDHLSSRTAMNMFKLELYLLDITGYQKIRSVPRLIHTMMYMLVLVEQRTGSLQQCAMNGKLMLTFVAPLKDVTRVKSGKTRAVIHVLGMKTTKRQDALYGDIILEKIALLLARLAATANKKEALLHLLPIPIPIPPLHLVLLSSPARTIIVAPAGKTQPIIVVWNVQMDWMANVQVG